MVPLTTIIDICVKCKLEDNEIMPKNALDNIESIYFEFDLTMPSSGWICDANWKKLEHLTITQINKTLPIPIYNQHLPNIEKVDFSHKKWHLTFPHLQVVSLVLLTAPFPYCSFTSILFESPNLFELSIHLVSTAIQEFNEEDFKNRLKNRVFKLKTIRLKNRFRPIIPFQSLTYLLDVSPKIMRMEATLSLTEEILLTERYNLEIVEDVTFHIIN